MQSWARHFGGCEYQRAGELFDEALDASRAAASKREIAWNLGVMAANQIQQAGDHGTAMRLLEESIATGRESGDLVPVVYSTIILGHMLTGEGNTARAREMVDEALAIARRIDARDLMPHLLVLAVCAAGALAVLEQLAQLVDRSMVMVEWSPGGVVRYRLLETVRQYARERMTEHTAVESLRRQHAFDALARPTWRTNERPGTVRFWRPPALPGPRVQLLGLAEDAVYALAGLLLAATALFALAASGLALMPAIAAHTGGAEPVLTVLDQILLVLILVKLFCTVRLSLREHELAVEPFVAVALIAAVRRILVLTAEEHRLIDGDPAAFQRLLLELGVLTGLILALVVALAVLRRTRAQSPRHPA